MVDYIIEGFGGGGETSSIRKRHLRAIMNVESNPLRPSNTPNSMISFFDLDFKGIDHNLHDPMVIFMVARNYIIRKVLVDILYASIL